MAELVQALWDKLANEMNLDYRELGHEISLNHMDAYADGLKEQRRIRHQIWKLLPGETELQQEEAFAAFADALDQYERVLEEHAYCRGCFLAVAGHAQAVSLSDDQLIDLESAQALPEAQKRWALVEREMAPHLRAGLEEPLRAYRLASLHNVKLRCRAYLAMGLLTATVVLENADSACRRDEKFVCAMIHRALDA